jgi:hypothetical protein
MDSNELFALGLGLTAPWKIVSQSLDVKVVPHRLDLRIEAERGALYPCPTCGRSCKAHDFKEFTWRHLNFFQHLCYGRKALLTEARLQRSLARARSGASHRVP